MTSFNNKFSPKALASWWQRSASKVPADTGREDFFVEQALPSAPAAAEPKPISYSIGRRAYSRGTWIREAHPVLLGNILIRGGLFYLGESLPTPDGKPDPGLIDPSLPVGALSESYQPALGYWPSYSQLTPTARRTHLAWLASGRRDPAVDIGHVFLHFYGLERRAVYDAQLPEAAADRPAIEAELRRLLQIYAAQSSSFEGYANRLLSWLSTSQYPDKSYLGITPQFVHTYDREVPIEIRVALGQTVLDQVPVPVSLALAWSSFDTHAAHRSAFFNCSTQYEQLFAHKYTQTFGKGLRLAPSAKLVQVSYEFASGALRQHPKSGPLAGIPDVATPEQLARLRPLVNETEAQLEGFSRFTRKVRTTHCRLERLSHLPPVLLQEDEARAFVDFKRELQAQMLHKTNIKALCERFNEHWPLPASEIAGLAKLLDTFGIGVLPWAMLLTTEPSNPDQEVILFDLPDEKPSGGAVPTGFIKARTAVEIALSIARCDGALNEAETKFINSQIDQWVHLTLRHRASLKAYLQWLNLSEEPKSTLKRKLALFEKDAKQALIAFLLEVTQADGLLCPKEIKALQKIYKACELDASQLFSHLHAVQTGAAIGVEAPSSPQVFSLDRARIAALQKDTHQVARLLATIFEETQDLQPAPAPESDAPVPDRTPSPGCASPASAACDDPCASSPPAGLTGLDAAHERFARLLLTRRQWTRAELETPASDLGLMLDGALEQLNDASFEAHGMALIEGEDPLILNTEIVEKL